MLPMSCIAIALLTGTPAPMTGAQSSEPVPRASHLEAVAFDSARGRLVLFGGSRRIADSAWTDSDEMWEWDGIRWHMVPRTAGTPSPRRGHGLAFDPTGRRIVLAGGVRTRPGSTTDEPFDETWFYDGQHWSPGPTLPIAFEHRLVFDAGTRTLLLLAIPGREVYVPRRLAVWRLERDAWVFVDSSGPLIRSPLRAAYDARRSLLVVPTPDDSVSRVWEWNGRRWRSIEAPGPSKRNRFALAYDADRQRVVLYGGLDVRTRTPLGDEWAWDGDRWSMTTSTGSPGPRASPALIFDAVARRLVLFGGTAPQRGIVSDLWTRRHDAWTAWTPGR